MKKVVNTMSWDEVFEYARKYYEYYGNLEVPNRFKTNDGITYDKDGIVGLGAWVTYQRKVTSPESEKGKKLISIGMRFDKVRQTLSFEEKYAMLKKYVEHYGKLDFKENKKGSLSFRTNDGITYDKDGIFKLENWVQEWRQKMDPNSKEGLMLQELGMDFKRKYIVHTFDENYEIAKKYLETHGNLKVKPKYRTNDGINEDPEGEYCIYSWIRSLKTDKKLTKGMIKKAESLGISCKIEHNNYPFEVYFKYLKIYYKRFGNIDVPTTFKTNDGYTHDPNGKISLGRYVRKLRTYYNEKDPNEYTKEDISRKVVLTLLGMRWDHAISTLSWDEVYEYAKIYFETNGNLKVPVNFKTSNGYEYDANGFLNLGCWIQGNRKNLEMASERYQRLLLIGMIMNVSNNKKNVLEACERHNIDYKENERILVNISYHELVAKIYFVKFLNKPLYNKDGTLHEIFYLPSLILKERYGTTASEIIETYYLNMDKPVQRVR